MSAIVAIADQFYFKPETFCVFVYESEFPVEFLKASIKSVCWQTFGQQRPSILILGHPTVWRTQRRALNHVARRNDKERDARSFVVVLDDVNEEISPSSTR
jgi:hypothetical protein